MQAFCRLNRLIKAIQSITQNLQTLVLVLSLALFFIIIVLLQSTQI